MLPYKPDAPSVLLLDSAFVTRPVNTYIFAPFLVARLVEHPDVQYEKLEYLVTLQDIGSEGTRTVPLVLTWTQAMVPAIPLAAQKEYITEAAAYGLAFAVLTHFTRAVLVDVAERGDRFDYIVAVDGVRYGLEVSGTQMEDLPSLRERHALKIRQLLDSPYSWGGYVVVVGFARREVILSYHAARGTQSEAGER